MGEDTDASLTPDDGAEGNPTDKDAEKLAQIETARKWLFDDDFVREETERDLKKTIEADRTRPFKLEGAIRINMDPETGLYEDEVRATAALDENIHLLMPGGAFDTGKHGNPSVPNWGGRTWADYSRDFGEVVRELGIDADEGARFNPSTNRPGNKRALYSFFFQAVEEMVLNRGYSLSLKYDR